MSSKCFFFAGGGTGGHIYPAIAVAERLAELEPKAKIHLFVSDRDIDSHILRQTGFQYTQLPAKGFSVLPGKLISFCTSFFESYQIAKKKIGEVKDAVVVGVGGFVAAPVCWAGYKLKVPVVLLNVDIVPGRANKIIARWAEEIFVQFEDTVQYFAKSKAKVSIVGCPLRSSFDKPEPAPPLRGKLIKQLELDENKKTLLITGASSGSESINETVCLLLEELNALADDWQIVHLTGRANFDNVRKKYATAKINVKVLDYCDDMPDLLSAADLVVGRSGAVSVAEYAAAAVPSICMPYPYHKDRHQYLNANKLVEAGAGIIVDDLPDARQTAERLWQELEDLMKNEEKRKQMKEACKKIANKEAASKIAEKLLRIVVSE